MIKGSSFKGSSKKYHPKGLDILYEDHDIIVVDKINGLLTIATDKEHQKTAHNLLNEYVKKGSPRSRNRVYVVHRLDKDTSGLLIFAKNENAKFYLQSNWKTFTKKYLAVIHGKLKENEGIITSYLLENKAYRVYSVNDPNKGKLSKTGYKTLKDSNKFSLLEIELYTGRKNQIRVHLSDEGHPIVGDKVYGNGTKGGKRLALHSTSLKISHPHTKEEMCFETGIPQYFKTFFKNAFWDKIDAPK